MRWRPLAFLTLLSGGCDTLWISGRDQSDAQRCVDALAALDEDGDGYVSTGMSWPLSCSELTQEEALALVGLSLGDCDDADAGINPDATDDCQGQIDKNCDGEVDALVTWYADSDGDGYGDPDSAVQDCVQPDGTVDNADDCDDWNNDVNPDAVETQCGPDATDLNCDGETDCALTGAISLDGDLGDLGTWVALEAGGGAVLAGEDDLAVAGGDEAAWTITGEDRDAAAELLDLGFEAGEEAGADVAVVDGVVAVGGPSWDNPAGGSYGFNAGKVILSAGGMLLGEALNTNVGRGLAAGGGTLAVCSFDDTAWIVYLIPESSLPDAPSAPDLSELDATLVDGPSGSSAFPPALALASDAGTVYVAVGQPAEEGSDGTVQIVEGDGSRVLAVSDRDDSSTRGSSVALLDLDGSGSLDLVVGDPGLKTVYVFLDPHDDLTPDDADYTFAGDDDTGRALANAGDINGDGVDDLLIGARNTAYLILGGNLGRGHELSSYAAFSTSTDTDLGASLASADLDGDGFSDLLLGAPGAGGVYVLWGGP